MSAKSSPKATFWKQATPGTLYYRCELPARHLPGQVLDLQFGDMVPRRDPFTGEPTSDPSFPRQEGVAVWQFPGNLTRGLYMKAMRMTGIRVLAEVDDNYLMPPPPMPNRRNTWKLRADDDQTHNHEQHRLIVGLHSDGVICSTPYLADQYRRFNPNVYVCRNQIDPDDWPEVPHERPDRPLTIGWAYSDSHLTDAPLVRRALDWASRQPDVQVVMLGADPGWTFRYRHVPWTDSLDEYRRSLGQLDVGICAVKDAHWQNSKSDVKALEYAMAGAMPIVSSSEPYKPWTDKDWYSAGTEKEWEKIIKHVVKNRDLVPVRARQARDYVLNERTIQRNIGQWEEAIHATS